MEDIQRLYCGYVMHYLQNYKLLNNTGTTVHSDGRTKSPACHLAKSLKLSATQYKQQVNPQQAAKVKLACRDGGGT